MIVSLPKWQASPTKLGLLFAKLEMYLLEDGAPVSALEIPRDNWNLESDEMQSGGSMECNGSVSALELSRQQLKIQ